jgi:NitT/TauT family transport system substrate-binding protein
MVINRRPRRFPRRLELLSQGIKIKSVINNRTQRDDGILRFTNVLKYGHLWSLSLIIVTLLMTACGNRETAEEKPTTESALAPESAGEMIKIRLPMGYIPDPQYAPFYVAVERGYFSEEGLDIEFDYSFETDGIALVGAGELPFAVVSGEQVILARAQNLPVVYIMEWFQRFPIAVISKAGSGIKEPADLAGRTVGLPGFFGASYVGYAGLLSANQIAAEDVNASDIGFTQVESLLTDQVEAVVGYVNNEPVQLAARGEDVNVIMVADSTDLIANGIITNEETISTNPQLISRFVRALMRGLSDTLDDPDQAFEISKKYVEALDDTRKDVLDASLALWQSDPLGITDAESWTNTQETLLEIGFLDAPLADLESSFTNEFLSSNQP